MMGMELNIDLLEGAVRDMENVYTQDQINNEALKAGAVPIRDQMFVQATRDPQIRTGALLRSIAVGNIKSAGSRRKIDIGVHSGVDAFYAAWVEFGHGGPRPAPPHAYVVPSYDARKDEAYEAMKRVLANAKLK